MTEKQSGGIAPSAKRIAILDATQDLMRDDGYAAVSTRRVATRAGVKPALVQHYFASMEELLLAVYRRAADQSIAAQLAALASSRPLHALWTLSRDAARVGLAVEFMALANHRKSIRVEIAAYSERARVLQAEALQTILKGTAIGRDNISPIGVSMLLAGVARGLVMEQGLGIIGGHAEADAIMARWLDEIEPADARRTIGSATAP